MEEFSWLDAGPGGFSLGVEGSVADLCVAESESPGIHRLARDLVDDWARVFGVSPQRVPSPNAEAWTVVVGTEAGNPLIAQAANQGLLDLTSLRGRWESCFVSRVGRVFYIVGSDDRGAIFGAYRLSEALGVSPWHWWSRTPVFRRSAWLASGPYLFPGPRVRYRGIFLNDEYPNLTRWVAKNWGEGRPGSARYGKEFYSRIFELLLRLGGNTLWPAMWNNAFYEDDLDNAALADEFGIVMGTSHQEPMTRAQKEWDRRYGDTLGSWDWLKHRKQLETFWREGIRARKDAEVLVTLGLRGADDTEMAQEDPETCLAMLQDIVAVQRAQLAEETGRPVETIPQVWCLYKEVLGYYKAGLRVPDDVTLLWPDDNWGHVRRVPDAAERRRAGGSGIYYHLDYHGGPRSYQWMHSTPLGKIGEQMTLAADHGADRLWIVNVGHLKGYEMATEYFLRLGWDPSPSPGRVGDFATAWARREFGPGQASVIGQLLNAYGLFNGRRKPELLRPETYSLLHYHESERVVAEYQALHDQAQDVLRSLDPATFESYYQTVAFPIEACCLLNLLYAAAGRHGLYREQGRASTGFWEAEVRRLFAEDLALMDHYNHEFAEGAWEHFMDQTHLGYTSWNDPPVNSLDALVLDTPEVPPGVDPGLVVEGGDPTLTLDFDPYRRPRRWVDLFRRGTEEFDYRVRPSQPWIRVSSKAGLVGDDVRLWIDLDWPQVPGGLGTESVVVEAGGHEFVVILRVFHPTEPRPSDTGAFVETDGVVVAEAEHWHRQGTRIGQWDTVREIGPLGSGVRACLPLDTPPLRPGEGSTLEYDIFLFSTRSRAILDLVLAPTQNFLPGRGLSWAWSWDDGPIEIVEAVSADFEGMHHNDDWERTVADGMRHSTTSIDLPGPGRHVLKIWMVDPGLLIFRIVLDLGGLKPSYLGPPESGHCM